MGYDVVPQTGYPFEIRLGCGIRWQPGRLSVRLTATNVGACRLRSAPASIRTWIWVSTRWTMPSC